MAKRRKKQIWPKVILTIVLSVILLFILLLLLFHVKDMEVQGMMHSSKKEVVQWIKKDKLSSNAIYVWWKCKYSKEAKPAAIDKMDVKFKLPWSIQVKVVEKKPIGYVDYNNQYLYFTQGGIAIYRTDQKIENVSYIEGMELNGSKVKMGKKIPVSDEKVFQRIMDASELLEKLNLKPDRVVCNGNGLNIYFEGVEVLLGKNDYDVKFAQLPPILKILKEKYPGLEGTLYLEHYEKIEKGIRFVPTKKEDDSTEESKPTEEEEPIVDDQTGGEDPTESEQIEEEEPTENTEVIEYTIDQVEE